MSKLYSKYEILKNDDNECLYLFLCGNFYIALDSDAIILNELFGLKLTKFSNYCDKCGFPKNALEKYEDRLNREEIKYKVINSNKSNDDILCEVRAIVNSIDVEKLNQSELKLIVQSIKDLIME